MPRLKKVACFDCENKWGDEAVKELQGDVTNKKIVFSQEALSKYCKRQFSRMMKGRTFCIHFTIEYWKDLGFEDSWGDAAVRNYPHLTILHWADKTDTKFLILAPYVTRRPIIIHAKDPYAWGSY